MAYGTVIRRGRSHCCEDGNAPCPRPRAKVPDTVDQAFREINEFVEQKMRDVGLHDQDFVLRALERDQDGNAIGVTRVRLGFDKLVIGATVAAGVVTVGIMTGAAGGSEQESPPPTTTRMSLADYRAELHGTCEAAGTKLTEQRRVNTDGLPLEDLVTVLTEQLDAVDRLAVPDELAAGQGSLTGALRDRIALLQKADADDGATDEQVEALLEQADVAAAQVRAAYVALGVTDCPR